LDFKVLADQFIKIDVTRHHVATHERRRTILNFKRATKLIENLEREKCDLAFVIFLVIKKAIAANAVTGYAFDHRDFHGWLFIRFAPVMAKKIVAVRNVKMADFHRDNDTIAGKRRE
jgi:hypothetical protein